ncbi:hypothetical protein [Bradyrhizobium neotropicale]|nr:hypothetical protein [Bradyrhizobium neotropicale]
MNRSMLSFRAQNSAKSLQGATRLAAELFRSGLNIYGKDRDGLGKADHQKWSGDSRSINAADHRSGDVVDFIDAT